MDIKTKVGNRIRELRQLMGISQETLANIAEVDRTYMTSVENGKRNISIITLEKIIKALNMDVSSFFLGNTFQEK